jgi:hypothetical protein
MNDEKCPFCGADKPLNGEKFNCGTPNYISGIIDDYRTEWCKDHQIVKLTEQLKAWKEYAKELEMHLIDYGFDMNYIAYAQKKLKDLEEL